MFFNVSLCIKIAFCLSLVYQLANNNRHQDAQQIAIVLTATTAILLWGRFFKQRKRRRFGFHSAYPVLIPLAIYYVCSVLIMSLGGLSSGLF